MIDLYAQIAEKSANLLQLAEQENWEEFPKAEAEMNGLVRQLAGFPQAPDGLEEHEILLHTVYLRQIMADNEKTASLVQQRTREVETFLKNSSKRQQISQGYGHAGLPGEDDPLK